jgi:hypothetical protein
MAASRLDELTPNTLPRMRTAASSAKRKGDFGSPMPRKVSKPEGNVNTTRKPANATEGLQYVHCDCDANRMVNREVADHQSEPYHSQIARTPGRR